MIDMTAADGVSGDARVRSNVLRLAAAQALTGANSAVIFATGSIVGATLALRFDDFRHNRGGKSE